MCDFTTDIQLQLRLRSIYMQNAVPSQRYKLGINFGNGAAAFGYIVVRIAVQEMTN